jgi:two-component system NarL family response regulator
MSAPAAIRILLVEDHAIVREALAALLARHGDLEVVGQAGTGEEAVAEFRRLRPDVTLMDLKLPGMSGVEAIRRLRADAPGARIIVLTTYDGDEDVHRSLEAGARGYILKSMSREELTQAIRAVAAGGRHVPAPVAARLVESLPATTLTGRERDVIRLLAQGCSNRDIARLLSLTVGTVKGYVHNVFLKLGVKDRLQAVTTALRRGITRPD